VERVDFGHRAQIKPHPDGMNWAFANSIEEQSRFIAGDPRNAVFIFPIQRESQS